MINVSNIERFATHDGPGIRTTIFLKGCSFHCPWCANPETWSVKSIIMYDEEKCLHCQRCVKECTHHAIVMDDTFHYNHKNCTGCQNCITHCPGNALTLNGTWMSNEEIIKEVLKDKDYYEESGGGITISGGEPLYQYDAFLSLVKSLKKENLHITIETTGHYPTRYLEELSDLIDLYYFDLKYPRNHLYHKITGGDEDTIYHNLEYLINTHKNVIVRIPVIPGYNEEYIQDIINSAKSLSVTQIQLLPYHNLGEKKWAQILKKYPLKGIGMMDKKHLENYKDHIVSIGGS